MPELDQISQGIGENVARVDVQEKASGAALFTDDIQFGSNLLHARIKRSPLPHAIIQSIDISQAERLPGVKAVVTGADFAGRIGLYLKDRHIFARDRVRFIGEPVAGVAAISEEIAEKALDLIRVEYEPLQPIFHPLDAIKPDAPLIHPDLGSYEVVNFIFPEPGTNISNHFKIRKGDVERAWAQCTAVVEREYYIPHIQHVPIETHVAVAQVSHLGKITLWSSSQSPFAQRDLIAKTLGFSPSDVRVISPYVGGGFGCKAGVTMEALPIVIAMKAKGFPVKLRLTREEEFYTNFVRQALVIRLKMGCDQAGNLLALENTMYWDGGASTEYGVNITRAGGYSSTGPYDVPNVKTDSYCVYTNNIIGGPYRGFGMSELHTGIEQCVDELADALGMDKVEFRLRNVVQGGDTLATGMTMHPTGIKECIQKVAAAVDWGKTSKSTEPYLKRGKGIAIMWKAPAMPPNPGSSATIKLNEDGTLLLGIGGQEIGQGTFTVMAQLAAATLGVPVKAVRIAKPVDTDYSPYEWQTVASRLTWSMGNAVLAAAQDARRQILAIVAEAWKEDVDDLDILDGVVISRKTEKEIKLKDFAVYGIPKENFEGWIGGPIFGRGKFMPTYVTGLDKETGQGKRAVVHYTTGAQAFEIEVDIRTGKLHVLRAAAAFDVGKAINPELVRAQMEGGLIQGLSSALFEQMIFKEGTMQNPNFVDYRIATTVDLPDEMMTFIVEVPQDDGPFGARGVGEHPMVPTVAGIANAIQDALGIRMQGPPFTAEKILLTLQSQEEKKG
ncbi:MAG: xanthine dehydrogenase family protein molybdopterin-binding subunit [Pelolinea sp.]|jgi:carbon-monoxide dehydrogenase large subunit|nr:xanthine dehydrogenase family protein molybdopterin-binding subunit [Pelolinea sp.]